MTPHPRSTVPTALAWGVAGALATAAVLPYAFDLLPDLRAKIKLPLAVVALAQAAQGGALLFALGFVGLSCSQVTLLDSPLVRGWFQRVPPPPAWKRRLAVSALLGAGTGALLLLLASAGAGLLPAPRAALPAVAGWKRLLAAFYGGVTEECIVHLFLMNVLAWCFLKAMPKDTPSARRALIGLALGVSALLFAAGHLPAVATLWPLSAGVVLRTLVLNGLGGALFGWLFWRWGFECAVVSHFCADLVLHGLGS